MNKQLKETFKDRNGKLSSKRLWGAVTLLNGLLIAWIMIISKILMAIGVLNSNETIDVEGSLILGILGIAAGLFGVTNFEKENQQTHTLPNTTEPQNDLQNEGLN